MSFYLAKQAKQEGYKLTTYGSVSSTNDLALELLLDYKKGNIARAGDAYLPEKHWIVAEQQLKGRGRRGRGWVSPKGNLYCSLVLYDIKTIEDCIALSYIAGISLRDSVEYFRQIYLKQEIDLSLKWPNDILLNNKKLSGILLEVKSLAAGLYGVVVGIGVNVAEKIENLTYQTSSLHEQGIICTPSMLFERLSYYWLENYAIYKSPNGAEQIRNTWLAYTSCVGKHITIKLQNSTISGTFESLDKSFSCLVRLEDNNVIKVNSGEDRKSVV